MKDLTLPEGHRVLGLEYITRKEFDQIDQLMELCCKQENINLKLELDYKLHQASIADRKTVPGASAQNEFLYYVNDELVSYLGICCFDGVTGELAGMTHPSFRAQGIFTILLDLAAEECRHRPFKALLILTDGNSETGMQYMKVSGYSYDHSEYRMSRISAPSVLPWAVSSITLRLACKEDEPELARQNAIYFNDAETDEITGELIIKSLADDPENYKTYIVELDGKSIGKINVEYGIDQAFICGFGIKPEYRGRGYGREALKATLRSIEEKHLPLTELDVVCTNARALTLYQSCGFQEVSVMNYYAFR